MKKKKINLYDVLPGVSVSSTLSEIAHATKPITAKAKLSNKEARKNFASRHNCDQKKDRTTPGYWSCRLPHYAKQLGMGANMNTFW